MITKGKLSLSQQKKGIKILLSFSFLNGVALTFITGNVLSLYLLKIGCSTPIVAIIASFGYLGTLFAFAGRSSISKIGAGLTLRLAWILCGFTAIILALIPFIEYLIPNKNLEMLLITIITFLFFIFKSIGTASTQPLMGEFTDEDNQGSFSSNYFLYYTVANILAMICIIGFISWHKTLIIFQLIILLGGVIKLACSCLFIGLNETDVPQKSAKSINTKKLLSTIWKEKDYRNFLFCRSLSRASLILIVPISILALKKLYGVSDQTALIFAFVQLAGGIVITYLNGVISEETGPKPLLIIYVMLLFIISLLWIFAPHQFNWGFCFIIFFIGGVCLCGLDSCLNYYYLTIIPRVNSVGISLWYTVISGGVAGIAGLFLGGGLIKLISMLFLPENIFRYYYGFMLLLIIPVFYIVYRLKSVSSWRLRDVLKLSIDPHEIHTLYVMHRLRKYSSADDELNSVNKLDSMNSDLSQDRLIYYLGSPKYKVRIRALRAMYGANLKQNSIKAILNELQFGEYTTGYLAAYILSDKKVKESIPLLRNYLSSKDHHLAASSMLGLVKLEDKESYPKIIQIYKESVVPMKLIYGTNAITAMKDINLLKVIIEKYEEVTIRTNKAIGRYNKECANCTEHKVFARTMFKKRDAVTSEIISSVADIAGIGNAFYEFLRIYANHHETGILNLIESIVETNPNTKLESPHKILHKYINGESKKTELIEYLKISAKSMGQNPTALILTDFLNKDTLMSLNSKLFYCLFMILFTKDNTKQ